MGSGYRNGGGGGNWAYLRNRDPDMDTRHTNLPEGRQQVLLDAALQEYTEAADDLREQAMERKQYWPGVGHFYIPTENTCAAHQQLIDSGLITFEPEKYPHSLKVLVEHADRPEITDPTHPDYSKFVKARENILKLVNDITGYYMDDGAFDPGDEKYIPLLESAFATLGDGLRYDKSLMGRLFMPSLSADILNIEAIGAAHAYDYLLSRQRSPAIMGGLRDEFRLLTGLPLREWGLPPRSATAFSDAGLTALAPPDALCMTPAEIADYCRQNHIASQPPATQTHRTDWGEAEKRRQLVQQATKGVSYAMGT